MEDFDRIVIDFEGHIEMHKNDMKIQTINPLTSKMELVEVKELTCEQIVDGLKSGKYYISFVECYQNALDGSETFTYEVEKE